MILAYSALLPFYFMSGVDEATAMLMELEASEYDRKRKMDSDTPLPASSSIKSYIGIEALPAEISELFPLETHRNGLVQSLEFISDGRDAGFYQLLPYKLANGETLYLVQYISEETTDTRDETIIGLITLMWSVGLVFLLVFIGAIVWVLRRISLRTSRLSHWAQSLAVGNCNAIPPDFGYKELNEIANQLNSALDRVTDALDREQGFVRNASHELRAPITVIQSNVELLTRQIPQYENNKSIQRIERATKNMKQLTETLLWLSRENKEQLQPVSVSLTRIIDSVIEESSYLLKGKDIQIEYPKMEVMAVIVETPCRIALSNLIRNAFQHSRSGIINIEITSAMITIRNNNNPSEKESQRGYGLGLLLVQKIVDRMGWQIEYQDCSDTRETMIKF
jgi:signal transduction histidine kinase